MIRTHLIAAAVLVVATAGAAGASVPSAATGPVAGRVTHDAAACGGAGFNQISAPATTAGYLCVHSTQDPFVAPAARGAALRPVTAPVTCFGDGTTGPRIQMIYGYYDGLPNRAAAVMAQFRSRLAPRMQAVINGQSGRSSLGLRFAWTKGCGAIDVKVVKFPSDVQYGGDDPADPNGQLGRAASYLATHGFNRSDRKYQVLYDGWNRPACGIGVQADLSRVNLGPRKLPTPPLDPINDGYPSAGGHTDAAGMAGAPSTQYSMIFNHAGGRHGPSCFESQGLSTVTPELHELFHTLGAVQADAPHANKTGHCDDAPSVMCPGQGPGYGEGVTIKACANVLVETLDCGMDDYWNPSPEAGSYLATHLNIARSQFFGSQPQDYLAPAPL